MQISPEQMEIYRRSACERMQRHQKELAERRERCCKLARQAAELLKEEFGATRVTLYGSLLHPQLFHLRLEEALAVWQGREKPNCVIPSFASVLEQPTK